jgi:arsenite-transporting ATPase
VSGPAAILLLGKGGVGKTTCALALGHALRRSGPVHALSLDPAHSLGDMAGVELGAAPRQIASGLEASEPDLEALAQRRAGRAVELMRSGYRHLDSLGLSGLADLIGQAPGLEEQSAVDALAGAAERGGGATLVVDMPPTGSSIRTLALPTLNLGWMSCLGGLRRKILERRSSIAHVRGRDWLGDVALEAGDDPVTAALQGEEALLGRARDLIGAAAKILVVNPEPLSVSEAARLRSVLVRIGTDAALVALNRSGPSAPPALSGLEDLPAVRVPDHGRSARMPDVLEGMGRLLLEGLR